VLRLLRAVPHPNILGRYSQHPSKRRPRVGPVPHQRLAQPPPNRGFTPPYGISYRGVKLLRLSAALGRSDLRRGADLPQVPTNRSPRLTVGPPARSGRVSGPG
jgi:hypothetical protein